MNPRVLYVDDDPAALVALRRIIAKAEWSSVSAASAAAAREILSSNGDIEVVLLDWMLPDGSGVEMCREIKAAAGALRYVILVTIRSSPEDIERGLDAGADDYIVKPVIPVEARARIRAGFRTVAAQRQLTAHVAKLQAALERVRSLENLLPLCMYCRRINSSEMWKPLEDYLWERADVKMSHGCCPDCLEQLAADFGEA